VSSASPATRLERLILYQLSAFAYVGCAALLVFTIARSTGYESAPALALYGVTPWLYLPVYAVVGYAFRARQRVLLALSLVVVVIHLVTIWPDIKPPNHLSAAVKNAPHMRVFSANLLFDNKDLSGIIAEVHARDPDIAVFEEVTPAHRARLLDDPALAGLPNRVFANGSDTVLFSRLPIESSEIWSETAKPMVRARMATAIGTVEVLVVHTVAPINGSAIARWRQMLDAIRNLAQQRTTPLLLVGDFNATVYHHRFDAILDTGLTDAHSARGSGFTGTWPRNKPVPPFLRIDHALSSKELVPTRASYGTGRGSDHRPIIVDYALVGSTTT
jgi:endonuclease/exonuclease/phosphatase (EEP) superfamily protein YafD